MNSVQNQTQPKQPCIETSLQTDNASKGALPCSREEMIRDLAVQAFLYGGGGVALILGSRAIMATSLCSLTFRIFSALTVFETSLIAAFVCKDPETQDVKSFANNFSNISRPLKICLFGEESLIKSSMGKVQELHNYLVAASEESAKIDEIPFVNPEQSEGTTKPKNDKTSSD